MKSTGFYTTEMVNFFADLKVLCKKHKVSYLGSGTGGDGKGIVGFGKKGGNWCYFSYFGDGKFNIERSIKGSL